jgi:hypothetical protein
MIRVSRRGGPGGSGCRCRGVRWRDATLVLAMGYDRLRVYLSRPGLVETILNKRFPREKRRLCIASPGSPPSPPSLLQSRCIFPPDT